MSHFNQHRQHGCGWGAVPTNVCVAIASALLISTYPTIAFAETSLVSNATHSGPTLRYNQSQSSSMGDFSDSGAPRHRGSAGSRGDCLVSEQPKATGAAPAALIPLSKGTLGEQIIDVPFGSTVSAHPTFWFQFAQHEDAIKRLDFTLVDETTQDLVEEIRDIPKIAQEQSLGNEDPVWGVQWPKTAAALEVDRTYRWFLVIQCHNASGSGTLLSGLVRRQSLSEAMTQQLAEAEPRERVFLYADNGIWHEAVTELRQVLQADPNNSVLQADWQNLLDSVGL